MSDSEDEYVRSRERLIDTSLYDVEDEYIRPADNIVRERLIDTSLSDVEDEMNFALNESLKDFEQTEESIFTSYNTELNKRQLETESIIMKLKKLSVYDDTVKDMLNVMEPIIELYCNQYINSYEFDKETYEFILNNIKKIRFSQEEKQVIENIFMIT